MNRSIRHSIKNHCHEEEEMRMVGSLLGPKAPLKQKQVIFALKSIPSVVEFHRKRFGRKISDLEPEEVSSNEEIGFMKSVMEIQSLCNNLEQGCTTLNNENRSYKQTFYTAIVFAMLLAIVSAFGSALEHHHQEAFETQRGLLRKQEPPQPKYKKRTLQMDHHEFMFLKDEHLKLQQIKATVGELENEKRELQIKQQILKDQLLNLWQMEDSERRYIHLMKGN